MDGPDFTGLLAKHLAGQIVVAVVILLAIGIVIGVSVSHFL